MILLTVPQIIFIIVCPVVAAILLFVLLYLPLSKKHHKKNFKEWCYKKLYSIANYHDYYIINNFAFSIDGIHTTYIDHILFGNKYIYVIMDKYYEGNLIGKSGDPSFIFISKDGTKQYTDNPFIYSQKLIKKLSGVSGLPEEMLIGVTLVNDECKHNIENLSKQFYLVSRKQINEFIVKKVEKREVGCINGVALQNAVATMAKINRRDEIKKDPKAS